MTVGSVRSGEIPKGVIGGNLRGLGVAPVERLNGVVVGKSDLLGTSGDGINSGVLDLFNEVFVTLLGHATTFFGIEEVVVGPNLRGGSAVVRSISITEIEIESYLMILKCD